MRGEVLKKSIKRVQKKVAAKIFVTANVAFQTLQIEVLQSK